MGEREEVASDRERADGLEGMCERLAESHVDLQEAVVWALNEAVAWRDRMPRTSENNTYPNGRQDGIDVAVRIVRAALSAHLRGENPSELAAHDERVRADERERLAGRLDRWVGHYRDDRRGVYYQHAARIVREPDRLIGPSERLAGERVRREPTDEQWAAYAEDERERLAGEVESG